MRLMRRATTELRRLGLLERVVRKSAATVREYQQKDPVRKPNVVVLLRPTNPPHPDAANEAAEAADHEERRVLDGMLHYATGLGIAQCSGLAYRRERAREDNKASKEEPVRDCRKDAVSAGNLVCLDDHGLVRGKSLGVLGSSPRGRRACHVNTFRMVLVVHFDRA